MSSPLAENMAKNAPNHKNNPPNFFTNDDTPLSLWQMLSKLEYIFQICISWQIRKQLWPLFEIFPDETCLKDEWTIYILLAFEPNLVCLSKLLNKHTDIYFFQGKKVQKLSCKEKEIFLFW